MIRTISGITLNLVSTLIFQFVLIRETKFNDVADSYYLALTFGLFAGSVITSMIQYTYQKHILRDDEINLLIVERIKFLTIRALCLNTAVIILSLYVAHSFFETDYFVIPEILLICLCGALQIIATISVVFGYSFDQKFGPGFSGIYPSIGSSIVFFKPTLTAILIGLSIGYVLQILQNSLSAHRFWGQAKKCRLVGIELKNLNERRMTLQYFLLSFSGFLQRILFTTAPGLSVSIFATAEKISQTLFSILTTGFNQFTFNSQGNGSQVKLKNRDSKKSIEIGYLVILFLIFFLIILFLRPIINSFFSVLGVKFQDVDSVLFFLRPLIVSVVFAAVGSLITNKLYSYGFVKINATTGIINASLLIASLVGLFLFESLKYTALAYAILSMINTLIKLCQWYFYVRIDGKLINKRDDFLELIFLLIGFSIIVTLSIVSS